MVQTQRVLWLDVARGLAVSLVVLMHVIVWIQSLTDISFAGNPVANVSNYAGLFRMALLFFVSGMLAASPLHSGLRRPLHRVGSLLYLALVWVCIYVVVAYFLGVNASKRIPDGHFGLPLQFVNPGTPLWFLIALAYATLLALALRRLPWYGAVAIAATVPCVVLVAELHPAEYQMRVLGYAPIFLLGVYFRDIVMSLMKTRLWVSWGIGAVVFGVLYSLFLLFTPTHRVGFYVADTFVKVLSLGVTVPLCVMLARWRFIAVPLAAIGRNALAVFVMSLPLVWMIVATPLGDVLHVPGLWAVWPAIDAVFCIGVAVGAKMLIDRTPFWALFEMPTVRRTEPVAA